MSANPSHELPLITRSHVVRDLMGVMDRCALGITLVVDDQGRLEATVTDGDVRRAILLGIRLDQSVADLVAARRNGIRTRPPITAPVGAAPEELLRLMAEHSIRQVPLLDAEERVVHIALESDYLAVPALPLDSLIMAGGFGKRLMPLTENCPKPMLPVRGKPILEHLVCKLRAAGIQHVSISTHYLAESIIEHFHDGKDFGIDIDYVDEDQPMGTAGSLAKASVGNLPLLVVNGDILTSINFRAMLEFHRDHSADMTVAVKQYEVRIPYGVITTDGVDAVRIVEKPTLRNFVNAGIYLVQPSVCKMVPSDHAFDMPDLITTLISLQRRVICFPIREYWLDIGRIEEYQRAHVDGAEGLFE